MSIGASQSDILEQRNIQVPFISNIRCQYNHMVKPNSPNRAYKLVCIAVRDSMVILHSLSANTAIITYTNVSPCPPTPARKKKSPLS